jgi:hypothetical protein
LSEGAGVCGCLIDSGIAALGDLCGGAPKNKFASAQTVEGLTTTNAVLAGFSPAFLSPTLCNYTKDPP